MLLSRQIERHTLGHKIFDVEIPQALLVITDIRANMPHAGLGTAIQRVVEAVEAVLRLNNDRACHGRPGAARQASRADREAVFRRCRAAGRLGSPFHPDDRDRVGQT